MPNNFRHQRGRVAALMRYRDPADPELLDCRRLMHEEAFLEALKKAVAKAPALSTELQQRAIAILSADGEWTY